MSKGVVKLRPKTVSGLEEKDKEMTRWIQPDTTNVPINELPTDSSKSC